jgi:hypothetical protein
MDLQLSFASVRPHGQASTPLMAAPILVHNNLSALGVIQSQQTFCAGRRVEDLEGSEDKLTAFSDWRVGGNVSCGR